MGQIISIAEIELVAVHFQIGLDRSVLSFFLVCSVSKKSQYFPSVDQEDIIMEKFTYIRFIYLSELPL